MSQQKHLTDAKVSDSVVHIPKGETMATVEKLHTIMAEVHRLANQAVGADVDWKALDRLYWALAEVADECEAREPQGDYRLTADGERVWAVGGFISYD